MKTSVKHFGVVVGP